MNEKNKRDSFQRIVERNFALYRLSLNLKEECPVMPEHVHIEPTNACNLRCAHCHQSRPGEVFTKRRGMMDLDLYRKVIDECKTFASRISLDNQGEPLLHPGILEMIKYAKDSGLMVSLLTNATRMTEEIARRLVELRLDRIVFSFEGSNKAVHEKVRRRSCYEETLKNLLTFIKLNYESGRHTFICMSMVESSYTKHDVQAYRDFFNRLPIDTIYVNPMLKMSSASILSDEVNMEKYRDIAFEDQPVCRLPWESIVVNWDGLVSACPVDCNESHIVGDANCEPLRKIFNGERMKKFRLCHMKKDFSWIEEFGPLCDSCNCRYSEEYDMNHLDAYVVNSIVRQADVLADRGKVGETAVGKDEKYECLLKEIEKLQELSGGKGWGKRSN